MNNAIKQLKTAALKLYASRTLRLSIASGVCYALAAHLGFIDALRAQLEPVLIVSAAFKLALVVVGVIATHNVLAAFDNKMGVNFNHDFLPQLIAGNVAIAVYLGARFVGACLLLGLVL